jgi:hypothetical protein
MSTGHRLLLLATGHSAAGRLWRVPRSDPGVENQEATPATGPPRPGSPSTPRYSAVLGVKKRVATIHDLRDELACPSPRRGKVDLA